jgi:hypothetical protein
MLTAAATHAECCAVSSIREPRCNVGLPSEHESWIVLSGTRFQASHGYTQKLCDAILFWCPDKSTSLLGLFELKGRSADISDVAEQLQCGADVAREILGDASPDVLAALVHRGLSTMAVRRLAKLRVRYRGKVMRIAKVRCGSDVNATLWRS